MTDNIKVMDSTNVVDDVKLKEKDGGRRCESSRAKVRIFDCNELSQRKVLQIQMCLKTEPQEERDWMMCLIVCLWNLTFRAPPPNVSQLPQPEATWDRFAGNSIKDSSKFFFPQFLNTATTKVAVCWIWHASWFEIDSETFNLLEMWRSCNLEWIGSSCLIFDGYWHLQGWQGGNWDGDQILPLCPIDWDTLLLISVLSVKSSVTDTQILSFLTHLSLHALWSRYGDSDDEVVDDADDDDCDCW